MSFSNYHTHTTFCDGKNTPEEMVQSAIARGMPELGFSGHAFMSHDPTWCMSRENTLLFRQEIARLKEKYSGQIRLFCGLEQDITSVLPDAPYDYLIGAMHYMERDGVFLPVDESAQAQINAANTCFGGDFLSLCEAYYAGVGTVWEITRCDMIAHFDLVTKYNEGGALFDEKDRRYRTAAVEALERLGCHNVVFEINTGAMSRGHRTTPYPAPFLLEKIQTLHLPVILSADAHTADNLTYGFKHALELVQKYRLELISDMAELKAKTQ